MKKTWQIKPRQYIIQTALRSSRMRSNECLASKFILTYLMKDRLRNKLCKVSYKCYKFCKTTLAQHQTAKRCDSQQFFKFCLGPSDRSSLPFLHPCSGKSATSTVKLRFFAVNSCIFLLVYAYYLKHPP